MAVPVKAAVEAALELAKNPKVQKGAKDLVNFAAEHSDQIGEAVKAAAPHVKKAVDGGVDAGAQALKAGAAKGADAAKAVGAVAADFADKAKQTADRAKDGAKVAAEGRAEAKALAEARRELLQCATVQKAASEFMDEWEAASQTGLPSPLKVPGHYVVAVYKGSTKMTPLDKYEDVYVGGSADIGASVRAHLFGSGNPDLYADFKYGQNLVIYAYPDSDFSEGNADATEQFMTALGAKESYNAREIA
ncbi:MAG: hypothetical protein IKL97_05565 [Eggerthellaceae bacterium]|nr:hypothetical protein [Eggerthellaceae bacterium]